MGVRWGWVALTEYKLYRCVLCLQAYMYFIFDILSCPVMAEAKDKFWLKYSLRPYIHYIFSTVHHVLILDIFAIAKGLRSTPFEIHYIDNVPILGKIILVQVYDNIDMITYI